jgi:hypothetical protein
MFIHFHWFVLLGFIRVHLEGNQCQALVDPRGFLHFPEKNETKHMSDA